LAHNLLAACVREASATTSGDTSDGAPFPLSAIAAYNVDCRSYCVVCRAPLAGRRWPSAAGRAPLAERRWPALITGRLY